MDHSATPHPLLRRAALPLALLCAAAAIAAGALLPGTATRPASHPRSRATTTAPSHTATTATSTAPPAPSTETTVPALADTISGITAQVSTSVTGGTDLLVDESLSGSSSAPVTITLSIDGTPLTPAQPAVATGAVCTPSGTAYTCTALPVTFVGVFANSPASGTATETVTDGASPVATASLSF